MHEIKDMEKMAERAAAKPVNRYDKSDIVRRVFLMNAEGLKFASYRVRDVGLLYQKNVESFSGLQHHLTYVPVKSFGPLSEGGPQTMIVNEIGATIYAMLEDEQALFLAKVVAEVEATEDFQHASFADEHCSNVVIDAYRVHGEDRTEFQVHLGPQVLGILPLQMAKMFCTLAESARRGGPLRDGDPSPLADAAAIAGEVDGALKAPMTQITAADLDGGDD